MPDYIDDMKVDFNDNAKKVYDKCKIYDFKSLSLGRQMRMQLMNKAVDHLGFDPLQVMNIATTAETAQELIDQMLVKHKIRIEDWSGKDIEDEKKGLYIYKAEELVYFISIMKEHTVDSKLRYSLKTNVVFN